MGNGTKTGGRKAGTPNKTTAELRELITDIVQTQLDRIPEYFEQLAPEQRLQAIIKLLPYALPKKLESQIDEPINPIEITMDLGNGLNKELKVAELLGKS